ncbi:exopolyphosphatase [Cryomorpha ignava]|uniref:Exopolyphosphatase n=1 Tax=Cryomorpha ignava TaxID=101383 RepID=A0A7K3WS65_9FLAO|nr:exopolyphosphatase [Cryomorpha ignava]NEN24520.1 exopolyphosphatase [Cryomorpha ignava]
MRFAAIDIGSNAVRLLIADVIETEKDLSIKKLSLTRVPIRLGASVFDTGKITSSKAKALAKTMKAFRYLIDVYNVKDFRACATSAMREADNAEEVIEKVHEYSGINIELINGHTEANMIFSTFKTQKLDPMQNYLYIDVGGGSTEITLLKHGKRISARSFKIGTVRILKGKVKPKLWDEMRQWVAKITANETNVTAIGTGGNINRLFKMSKLGYGELMTRDQLEKLHAEIKAMPFKQRIEKLRLRPDRADVIVPAGEIFTTILNVAKIDKMSVPKIGLSDGIALYLYRQHVASIKTKV